MADTTYNVKCGFFDSVEGDRLYSADDMNKVFQRIVNNGVFANSDGTASTDFQTINDSGMKIKVKKGQGIFGGRWFNSTADITITVPSNSSGSTRIDSVIAQVDTRDSGRTGKIVYRTGTPSSSPVHPDINQTTGVHEYRLADVTVTNNSQLPSITDKRGTDTPWVSGLIASTEAEGYTKAEDDALLGEKVDKLAEGTDDDMILLSNDRGISTSGKGIQQSLQNTNDYVPTSGAVYTAIGTVADAVEDKADIVADATNGNLASWSVTTEDNETVVALADSGISLQTSNWANASDTKIPSSKFVNDSMSRVFKDNGSPVSDPSQWTSVKLGDIYIDTQHDDIYILADKSVTALTWTKIADDSEVSVIHIATYPSTSTVGKVGDICIDGAHNGFYICRSASTIEGVYNWEQLALADELDDYAEVYETDSDPTSSDSGSYGQIWVNSSNHKVFMYVGLSGLSNLWAQIVTSENNPNVFSGNTAPSSVDGAKIGDIYINTNSASSKKIPCVMTNISGSTQNWNTIITDLQVQTSGDGTTDTMVMSAKLSQTKFDDLKGSTPKIWSGSSVPSPTQGVYSGIKVGDIYINTSALTLYIAVAIASSTITWKQMSTI